MAYRDQQRYLDMLKKYEKKLTRDELDQYKLFLKMHKDEEDFDSVSLKKLKELYEKYYTPVDKSKFDAFFKKSENN